MRYLLFSFIILTVFFSYGQNCDCNKELTFVINKIENNLPAYFDQVNDSNRSEYMQHSAHYLEISSNANTQKECIATIMRYLSFFKDEHLYITYKEDMFPVKNRSDTAAIKQFIRKDPRIEFNIDTLNKKSYNSIEGIWQTDDGVYIIGICADKTKFRDYIGFIIESTSLYWEKGQIKFEFKTEKNGSITCLGKGGYRIPYVSNTFLSGDTLKIDRDYFTFIRYKKDNQINKPVQHYTNTEFIFRQLSEQTLYFGIPGFLNKYKTTIDSIIEHNLTLLKSAENLIIDIRNNPGGNSPSLYKLLPIIYTDPVNAGCMQRVASLDNIKHLEYWRDSVEKKRYERKKINRTIELMKTNVGKLLPCEPNIYTTTKTFGNIKNVAVLANINSGSTSEEFLIYCKQSSKTKIYGENSSGTIAYGGVRGHDMPNLPYKVHIATNKTGFPFEYESDGVPADIYLDVNEESKWIEQVQKMIER